MSFVWLSHIISNDTPLYGSSGVIEIAAEKSIVKGDSCNTSVIKMPSHTGTHVDAPLHFVATGKAVDCYAPEEWIFTSPAVIQLSVDPGQLINSGDIPENFDKNADMVLIRTGFEKYRGQDIYWQNGPGLLPELAGYLLERSPGLRGIGIDFISISSMLHRDVGRKAHKAFLDNRILLFEDMALSNLLSEMKLVRVMAFPLRFIDAEGAPVTVIGVVDEHNTTKT